MIWIDKPNKVGWWLVRFEDEDIRDGRYYEVLFMDKDGCLSEADEEEVYENAEDFLDCCVPWNSILFSLIEEGE